MTSWLQRIALALAWGLCIPFAFVILFLTIEIQSAAKNIPAVDPKIASFMIESRQSQREAISARLYNDQVYERKLQTNLAVTRANLNSYQAKLIFDLIEIDGELDNPIDAIACTSAPEKLTSCYDDTMAKAARTLRTLPTAQKDAIDKFILDANLTFGKWLDESNNLASTQSFLVINAADQKLDQSRLDDLYGGKYSVDNASLDHTYQLLRQLIPNYRIMFLFPTGVIVALFTGVMGSIGAAVRSLFNMLNPVLKNEQHAETVWQSFAIRPMLGALAGFIVYFVISAGASFLVQPTVADATTAVNNLSPSALASLGIFAGLAAEDALEWLIAKAKGFFSNTKT